MRKFRTDLKEKLICRYVQEINTVRNCANLRENAGWNKAFDAGKCLLLAENKQEGSF